MNHVQFIGLPVIVSARHRIVLDQGLCRRYGIPENGLVKVRKDESTIFIHPADFPDKKAELKHVTIGRFNLPMEWVQRNKVKIGGYAYLMPADHCLQLRWMPWGLDRRSQILGIPIKIFPGGFVYIPRPFWVRYGFFLDNDKVIRQDCGDHLLFQPIHAEPLSDDEAKLRISTHRVYIPPCWMKSHELTTDDIVWLIGTEDGLEVYPKPINQTF